MKTIAYFLGLAALSFAFGCGVTFSVKHMKEWYGVGIGVLTAACTIAILEYFDQQKHK